MTSLSESDGFTVIMVFIDKLTKMVDLVRFQKEVRTMEYANVFIDAVFWLYGLLKVIISKYDPHFIGKFCNALSEFLGMDL